MKVKKTIHILNRTVKSPALNQPTTNRQRQENIEKIPKTLPIFLIAGQEDPVGNYGKGVRQVYKSYKNAGILDVDIKLYKGDRHEILNEKDREQVFADILSWMHC